MKLLYKPFGIVAGVFGAKLGQNIFKTLWSRIDDSPEPPRPKTQDASLGKVVAANALEAATLAGVAALVDRLGMRWFHYLTGIWPGDKPAAAADDLPPGRDAD
jgi:hypothetical protein